MFDFRFLTPTFPKNVSSISVQIFIVLATLILTVSRVWACFCCFFYLYTERCCCPTNRRTFACKPSFRIVSRHRTPPQTGRRHGTPLHQHHQEWQIHESHRSGAQGGAQEGAEKEQKTASDGAGGRPQGQGPGAADRGDGEDRRDGWVWSWWLPALTVGNDCCRVFRNNVWFRCEALLCFVTDGNVFRVSECWAPEYWIKAQHICISNQLETMHMLLHPNRTRYMRNNRCLILNNTYFPIWYVPNTIYVTHFSNTT